VTNSASREPNVANDRVQALDIGVVQNLCGSLPSSHTWRFHSWFYRCAGCTGSV